MLNRPALFTLVLTSPSCYTSSAYRHDGDDITVPEPLDAIEDRDEPGDPRPEAPMDPDMEDPTPETPADLPVDEAAEEEPGITWEEYCMRMYTAHCANYTACCTPEELDHLSMTEGWSCRSPEEDSAYRLCMEIIDRSGKIIDEAVLESCELKWQETAASCPGFGFSLALERDPACQGLLHGTLPEGASCGGSGECAEGLFCHAWDDICIPREEPGGFCRENDGCLEGLICFDWSCYEPRGEGGRCDEDYDCQSPLWCDEERCRPLLPAGESCEWYALWGCAGLCSSPGAVCEGFCDRGVKSR